MSRRKPGARRPRPLRRDRVVRQPSSQQPGIVAPLKEAARMQVVARVGSVGCGLDTPGSIRNTCAQGEHEVEALPGPARAGARGIGHRGETHLSERNPAASSSLHVKPTALSSVAVTPLFLSSLAEKSAVLSSKSSASTTILADAARLWDVSSAVSPKYIPAKSVVSVVPALVRMVTTPRWMRKASCRWWRPWHWPTGRWAGGGAGPAGEKSPLTPPQSFPCEELRR